MKLGGKEWGKADVRMFCMRRIKKEKKTEVCTLYAQDRQLGQSVTMEKPSETGIGGCGHRGLPFGHFTLKTLEFVPAYHLSVASPMCNGHKKYLPQFKTIQDSRGSAWITSAYSPRSVALIFLVELEYLPEL